MLTVIPTFGRNRTRSIQTKCSVKIERIFGRLCDLDFSNGPQAHMTKSKSQEAYVGRSQPGQTAWSDYATDYADRYGSNKHAFCQIQMQPVKMKMDFPRTCVC
ncbi:hypothetical protein TNCT_167151 [Trichonephila clavata]|uniref:Uncharacterized protein n=1 Tax=Trichonephila clavata TaxID=2740835 RepID=A0A8X6LL64_TRICU|nr:hypothetical protein TNCT_167151 [Trichonephila clavata]